MTTPASPPATASSPFDELASWLQDSMSELDVPGAAIGIFHGDERDSVGLGVTKAGTDDAFTTSTPFGIASLTKIFTATAMASLVHDGAVSLSDPVSQYLPEFGLSEPDATETVTIGHLVSHAGGWADVLEPIQGQDSLAWYATQMGDLPQIVPAGTHFSYSNSGFLLTGAILEQLTGAAYEDVISESVLKPLGMDHTMFKTEADDSTNQATGHQVIEEDLAAIPLPDVPRAVNPAAGLLSTVDDMLTFLQAHTAKGADHIDAAALSSMQHPLNSGGSVGPVVVDNIGTGWMLLDTAGETVLMSQGGDSGLNSAMIAVPSHQFGMVILANSDTAMMLVNDAVLRGMSAFTGLEVPEPEMHFPSIEEANNADGQFGLPEWMTFTIEPADGAITVTASAGRQELPDMSGRLTMVSSTSGYMPYQGGRLWLDFVPNDTGSIQWLRFAGRLVPRME